MNSKYAGGAAAGFLALAALASVAWAEDWPQWRGPQRDGVSKETGLRKSWPDGGPPLLWKIPLGNGFSSVSVVDGRAYTMFGKDGQEFVVCLDAATGRRIWEFRSDVNYTNERGDGPRSNPLVHDGVVYTVGGNGKLNALKAVDGQLLWTRDFVAELGGEIPIWGYSTTPLIEGDLLVVEVGGKPGKSIVAFDKKDGSTAWSAHESQPGYSSPIAVTVEGERQLVFFTGASVVSLSPRGEVLWTYPWPTINRINIASPVFVGAGRIFIGSGYDMGSLLLRTGVREGAVFVEEVWKNRVMKSHFQTPVWWEGILYGFDNATFKALDVADASTKWRRRGYGKGSLIAADGLLIVLAERGKLALVEATPDEFREISSFQLFRGRAWTPPTLAQGRLYVRNEKEMYCLDLSADRSLAAPARPDSISGQERRQ